MDTRLLRRNCDCPTSQIPTHADAWPCSHRAWLHRH
ncbi:SWIM zinc finger family protein [Opitutia bacterium ISCC 51]|nr:SWIM zinc finger family protein [Opitutae bacterium ISCC 51]QXD26659.1 SWIM zinc finger family protein [Opitutae bacterium ISCC 52]